ncbi:MAG: hypothetical protein ACRYFW_09875 [Janthinobacterium lividum]
MAKDGAPTRWTADTEVAFLFALRQTGVVATACAAIGRSTHGASDRRRRLPEFAARWQAVLDERQRERTVAEAAGGAGDRGVMDNRVRYDGWTPLRQRAFLRALSETGEYKDACRAVRVSTAAARAMRRLYPGFAAACDRAQAQAEATLEQVAYERAVEGWDEPIVHAGKIVGQRRRWSEPLLRLLLEREARREEGREVSGARRAGSEVGARATAEGRRRGGTNTIGRRGGQKRFPTDEEITATLLHKLDRAAEANARRERERMLAWADDMVRRGLAP